MIALSNKHYVSSIVGFWRYKTRIHWPNTSKTKKTLSKAQRTQGIEPLNFIELFKPIYDLQNLGVVTSAALNVEK